MTFLRDYVAGGSETVTVPPCPVAVRTTIPHGPVGFHRFRGPESGWVASTVA